MKLKLIKKTTKTGKDYYCLSFGPCTVAIKPAFAMDKDGNSNKQEWAKWFSLIEIYTATTDNDER